MPESITIHVCDERNKQSRDFKCAKHVLLSEMGYFQDCAELNSKQYENDDISITVYCDLETFGWLHAFITSVADQGTSQSPPSLAPNSVLSILISADFLRMPRVTDLCVQYIGSHLDSTLQQPIDFSCLSEPLLLRIASNVVDTDLEAACDPQDKLTSKLFRHKVQMLLASAAPTPHSPSDAHCMSQPRRSRPAHACPPARHSPSWA